MMNSDEYIPVRSKSLGTVEQVVISSDGYVRTAKF